MYSEVLYQNIQEEIDEGKLGFAADYGIWVLEHETRAGLIGAYLLPW